MHCCKRLPHRCGVLSLLAAIVLLTSYTGPQQATARQPEPLQQQVKQTVKKVVQKEKIPGMVAAIAGPDGVIAIAASGVRKAGGTSQITTEDQLHIGSCTKAMTSVMLATLVQEKKLTWKTTLIQVLPELRSKIHRDYHNVTLWQLVSHRSRMPANPASWWVHQNQEIKQRRLAIVTESLSKAPVVKKDTFEYSNLGYLVAGCMAEKITGQSWEQLMQKRVFGPLGMTTAGFGPPGERNKDDQPWGHTKADGAWQPKYFDNAAALGPAGTVHCSVADWAKFAALQLPGKPKILNRKVLDFLATPQSGEYAAGWGVLQRPWARGTVISHAGSNTMWFAVIWVAPKTNRIYIAVTNSGEPRSAKIVDSAIAGLIESDTAK